MKTSIITFSLLTALVVASCGDKKPVVETPVKKDSVEAKVEEPAAPVDSATMAKAWIDFGTPGDMQKWLASYDGKWNCEMTSWMSPDAPPMKTAMTAESKMILGGLYQHATYKGTFENMPYEGISTMAYDKAKKIFVNTWIDNMGSGITVMSGKMDDAGKTMTLEGVGTDPVTGGDVKMRQVLTFPDANTQNMEMYCEKNGKEEKNMEMKMTRK